MILRTTTRTLVYTAISFRLVVFLLGIIADLMFKDNDMSTDLFFEELGLRKGSILYTVAHPWVRWDSFYFLDAAHEGYISQKNHAFFPLFPLLLNKLNITRLTDLFGLNVLNVGEGLVLTSLLINFVAHVWIVVLLYKLGNVFFSEETARKAAILYIFNPASVFLTSPYTETIFTLFASLSFTTLYSGEIHRQSLEDKPEFVGEYALLPKKAELLFAGLFIMCACFVRSNGIFLLLVPGYLMLRKLALTITGRSNKPCTTRKKVWKIAQLCVVGLILLIAAGLPSYMVFLHPYRIYCQGDNGRFIPEWCSNGVTAIYTHIQLYYWNVGFLKYWTMSMVYQISMGMLCLTIMGLAVFNYIRVNPKDFFTLNFWSFFKKDQRVLAENAKNVDFYKKSLLPFVWITLMMLILNFFLAHVMVSTRINSFNPLIYWFMIEYLEHPDKGELRMLSDLKKKNKKEVETYEFSFRHHWMRMYVVFFIVSGILHFANFDLWV